MSITRDESLVTVFTSPVAAEAELVCNALLAQGLHATVAQSNGPFTGLLIAPSEVLVWQEDEERARTLIHDADTQRHEREEREAEGCCDADRDWQE